MSDAPKQEGQNPEPVKSDPPIKPKSTKSVAVYLVILFAAAFLLLLMAYFMQQRSNNEVIGSLQNSVSQFQTVDELREENQALREELDGLEEELEALRSTQETTQSELDRLKNSYELLEGNYNSALIESSAIKVLYDAEVLLAQRDYSGAAARLTSVENLADIVQGCDAKNQHYNPDAILLQPRYDTLVAALVEEGVLTQGEDGSLNLVPAE